MTSHMPGLWGTEEVNMSECGKIDKAPGECVLFDMTMALSRTHRSGIAFFESTVEWQSLSMVQVRVNE